MADDELGIEHLKATENLANVTSFKHILARNLDSSLFRFGLVDHAFQAHLLEVEDDVGHVLLHAWNRSELVFNAIDANVAYCIALKRREQDAAQSIADGHTITRFQWAELEFAEGVVGFQHQNFVWFLKC